MVAPANNSRLRFWFYGRLRGENPGVWGWYEIAPAGFMGSLTSLTYWNQHQTMPKEFDHVAMMVSVGDEPPAGIEPHSQLPTGGTNAVG